jgi:glycerol-3-phosphate dehydrogenase
VFFALPWGSHTLIGTTDVDEENRARAPGPSAEDIRYLTEEAARALPAAEGMRPVRAFAGLRSLVRSKASLPWANPREHRVLLDDGMMTLIGGKYTTHRSLAERVVDQALAWLKTRAAPCSTATTPLPAGRVEAVRSLESRHPGRIALPGGLSLSEAEVAHAVTKGKARRLEDVPESIRAGADLLLSFLSSRKLATSSSRVTVAVPSLLTTTALPWLAISAASIGVAPQTSPSVKSAIAVSPAPETSKT